MIVKKLLVGIDGGVVLIFRCRQMIEFNAWKYATVLFPGVLVD